MQRVFTPWRIEYVRRTEQPGCIFCDLPEAGDDREALVVHRGERAYIVLNKYPFNNGHFMAVPYRHASSLEELSPEELADLMALVNLGTRALRSCMRPAGFNIGVNIGKAAGAGVQGHVHMHVVPRWGGDANFMAVVADVKLIPQTLAETYDQLKAAIDAALADGQEGA